MPMSTKFQTVSSLAPRLRAECKGRVKEEEKLSSHTTIKIGGPAECWFEPEDEASLAQGLKIAAECGAPVWIVGGGSNLLPPDEGLKGLVVHLSGPVFKALKLEGEEVVAGAAVPITQFLPFLVSNGFGDCEYLMGVPAQIGGAVMMNAGSATRWIGSFLTRAWGVTLGGEKSELAREAIPFEYRSSGLKDFVITQAAFKFPRVPAADTRKRLNEYSDYRRKTQDLKFPNAGCMFRNPEGDSAGRMIEQAGLKGRRAGGAQVSEIHANFVVNTGGATRKDVLELLDAVEKKVYQQYAIRLHREIRILG